MQLTQELDTQLRRFLKGDMSLSDYRQWMMQVRLEKLNSMSQRDQNFVYDFETRYAQLTAGAVTEFQFKQLLTHAAAIDLSYEHTRT